MNTGTLTSSFQAANKAMFIIGGNLSVETGDDCMRVLLGQK